MPWVLPFVKHQVNQTSATSLSTFEGNLKQPIYKQWLSLKEVLVDPWGIHTYKNTVLRILKKSNNCLEDHQFFAKFHMKMDRFLRYWNQLEPRVVNKKYSNRLPVQHCCNIKTTICKRISLSHQNLQAKVRCMVQGLHCRNFRTAQCVGSWFIFFLCLINL